MKRRCSFTHHCQKISVLVSTGRQTPSEYCSAVSLPIRSGAKACLLVPYHVALLFRQIFCSVCIHNNFSWSTWTYAGVTFLQVEDKRDGLHWINYLRICLQPVAAGAVQSLPGCQGCYCNLLSWTLKGRNPPALPPSESLPSSWRTSGYRALALVSRAGKSCPGQTEDGPTLHFKEYFFIGQCCKAGSGWTCLRVPYTITWKYCR